jgi:hypothetical protein
VHLLLYIRRSPKARTFCLLNYVHDDDLVERVTCRQQARSIGRAACVHEVAASSASVAVSPGALVLASGGSADAPANDNTVITRTASGAPVCAFVAAELTTSALAASAATAGAAGVQAASKQAAAVASVNNALQE